LHADGTSEPLGPPTNLIKLRPDGMSIGAGIKMASRHRGNRFSDCRRNRHQPSGVK
jgi:hypothetical protein